MVDPSDTSQLHRLAITAALSCEWQKALELNEQIIKLTPEDTDCLNRLAKAHLELGQYPKAKKAYEEVLRLDPYNSIAQKNLKKIDGFKANGKNPAIQNHQTFLSASMFIEEPCTTKLVNLIKVAEPQKLLTLSPGQMVNLVVKNRGVSVTDSNSQYLGVLPDDVGFLIRRLMSGGNKYIALLKSVKSNGLTILIREVFRSKKFKNQASFLDEARILAYSSDNISLLPNDLELPVDDQADGDDVVV